MPFVLISTFLPVNESMVRPLPMPPASSVPSWKFHDQFESPSFPWYGTYYRTSNLVDWVCGYLPSGAGKSRGQEPFLHLVFISGPVSYTSTTVLSLLSFWCLSASAPSLFPLPHPTDPLIVSPSPSSFWDDFGSNQQIFSANSSLWFSTLSHTLFFICES